MGCELCEHDGGRVLWRDELCRIVRPEVEDYPGYCRVILNRHVGEMTDLAPAERERLMRVVYACEQALRALQHPDKINLASLGNQVPHLHWHVIARHAGDRHFPDSIWSPPRRSAASRGEPVSDAELAARVGALLASSPAPR